MRGRIHAASLLACAWPMAALAVEPSPAPAVDVERAVATALERNLELKAVAAGVEAARGRRSTAGLISNPEVEAEAGPRRQADGTKSTDLEVSLSQALPLGGQRGARISVAEAGLRTAQARLELRRVEIAAQVRTAYAQAIAADQRLRLAREADQLGQEALRAAEERLRAGATSHIEVNTARGQRGRVARDLIMARQEQAAALATLRLLLGSGSREPVVLPAAGPHQTPASPVPLKADPDALISQAAGRHPAIRIARAELDMARSERTLAGKQAIPDLNVGVVAAREEGAEIVKGRLGFALPIFDRRQGERQTAAAQVTQAERALEAAERRLEQDLRVALVRREAAAEAVDAYAGDVIKALSENLALVSEAYRAGKIDFLQLLLIRRETLEARRAYIDTLEELATSDAELKRAMGVVR